MDYFDSHTHLNLPEYNKDREEAIKRTKKEKVGLVNVGTDLDTSKLAVELARDNENMFATVGRHPTYSEEFNVDDYTKLAGNKKVVAIGECGLDYYRTKLEDKEKVKKSQKEVFEKHIKLAKKLELPLMIHCRPSKDKNDEKGYSQDAYQDVLEIIRPEMKNLPGAVIHFFVGTKEMAKEFLELGCFFTFGGVITFTRVYDDVIKSIPLENILLETDAPYVSPEPHRGKRNEPVFVKEVYKKMAEIKEVSLEGLKRQALKNNSKVFKLPS